jgi:VanZ family protein
MSDKKFNEEKDYRLKTRLRFWYSLPAVLIAVTIFWLSNATHPEFPHIGIEWEDKIAHSLAYFIFGISLIMFLLSNTKWDSRNKIAIVTIIIGALYGFSDELHQYFIPGRDAEFLDWVADIVGISISLIFIKILKNKLIEAYVRK